MRVILALIVRNEEEMIRANLDYHLAQGVDLVMVTAHRSEDRTVPILREYEERGQVDLKVTEDPVFQQAEWLTSMAKRAVQEQGADWLLYCDADEFWWPERGSLRTTLERAPRQSDFAHVKRYDFLLTPVKRDGPFWETMRIHDVRSRNSAGRTLPPKVCHRATVDVLVAPGSHAIESGTLRGPWQNPPMCILHYPIRSYEQFEQKIVLGVEALPPVSHHRPGTSSSWRELYEKHKAGRLREYYDRQVIDPGALRRGLAERTLVEDGRLARYMTALNAGGPAAAARSRRSRLSVILRRLAGSREL